MLAMRHVKSLVASSALVPAAAWGMGGVAHAADPFGLSSATFKDGTMMPKQVANKNPQNPWPANSKGRLPYVPADLVTI